MAVSSSSSSSSSAPICLEDALEVRQVSESVGMGLFARKRISAGSELIRDLPIVSTQHAANKFGVSACAYCYRYFPADQQFARIMCSMGDNQDLPLVSRESMSCGCGEVYCSVGCQERAWQSSHWAMCVARETDESPLVEFKQYALEIPGSGDTIILAAELYCKLVKEAEIKAAQQGMTDPTSTLIGLIQNIMSYSHGRFSQIARGDGDDWQEWLNGLLEESYKLMKSALFNRHPLFACFFGDDGPELYDRILGVFERNNADINLAQTNPLITELMNAPAAKSIVQEFMREFWDEDESDGIFEKHPTKTDDVPTFHGTGLYPKISRLNHSCDFSARLDFDGRLGLCIATRDIEAGEEIRISYLGSKTRDIPTQERKESLIEYGFDCQCKLCSA